MNTLIVSMLLAAVGWAVLFCGFVYALKKRWLGRYEHGFFFSLLIALAGVALMTASVVGMWGYQAAKHILEEELIVELTAVGGIVEAQIVDDIDDIQKELDGLGDSIESAIVRNVPLAELKERLETVQSVNKRFVQLRVVDTAGSAIVSSSEAADAEPLNRIAIAFNLDGKPFVSEPYFSTVFKRQVLYISIPIQREGGPIRGAVTARYDMGDNLRSLVGGSKFNKSGYAVIVDGDGEILAHPNPARIDQQVASYPAVQLARQSPAVGHVVAPNAAGRERLFVYRQLKNPGTLAKQPWVLLTEVDQEEALASLRELRRELFIGIAILLAGTLLVAHQVGETIRRPLEEVRRFAQRVGAGDLTAHLDLGGRDIAGSLAKSLNEMVDGLQERDHVKEVFGRYIATQVSDKILKGEVNLGGEARNVTILFSDIRNFTGMSEQMTPQQVITFLNDYFTEMVDAVFEHGGMLDKFIGDGLMAVFGSLGDQPDHPRRAVTTALRMKSLLAKINGERSMSGKPPIAIGVGIHTDEVIVGNIGSRKRLEYTVVGDGVNTSSRLQGLNKEFGTTILISETTYEAVKNDFECRVMPEAQLRGKTKELRFYEVISVKAAAATV